MENLRGFKFVMRNGVWVAVEKFSFEDDISFVSNTKQIEISSSARQILVTGSEQTKMEIPVIRA